MPISDTEWNDGVRADSASATGTTPVGAYEDEKELIGAFRSENVGNAYTRTEIVRGIDFGTDARTGTVRDVPTGSQDEPVDVADDVVASGMLVDDIDEALDELVAEGVVAETDVETADRTATYYRLTTDGARE